MSDTRRGTDMKNLLSAILLMTAMSVSANAQEQGHLNVTTTVQKEQVTVNEAGETERQLVAADTVVPGEKVI